MVHIVIAVWAFLFLAMGGVAPRVGAQTVDDVCDGLGLTGAACDTESAIEGCRAQPWTPGCENVAERRISDVIRGALNVISAIVGIVAVVMIIFGGYRYITAGGDSGKVSTAQTTIIYAIIGLIIVALAQVIVRFVLSQTFG